MNVDRGLIEDLFLGALQAAENREVFFLFLFLCKDVNILQGDSTDAYNALILFFKRNYVCVYVCVYADNFSEGSILIPSPYPLPSSLSSGMREGKTEWDLEFSC